MSGPAGIRALQPIVGTWLEASRNLDLDKIADLCDFEADFSFQPMETEYPLTSAKALERYGEAARKNELRILDFAPTDMTYGTCRDMLWAWVVCYYKALYPSSPEPVAAPVRVTLVAHRKGGQWKLVCVHHSTQQRTGLPAGDEERARRTAGDPEAKAIARGIAETFSGGWANLDLDIVRSVWDREHASLIYMAFEGPQALRTWPAMEQYAERLRENGLKSGTRFRWSELTFDDISAGRSGDFLWAHCLRDFVVYHPGDPEKKLGGHPYRETWLAHRRGGEWRAFHYHESVRGGTPLARPFVADWWPD